MTLRTKVAAFSVALLGIAAAGPASAQTVGQAITNSLNNNSRVIRQQTDTALPKAKAEPTEAKAGQTLRARFTGASSGRYSVGKDSNDFALLGVPTYRLPSGVSMQFSGEFSPSEGVTCTSNCPVVFSTKR